MEQLNRLEQARQAYARGDYEGSAEAHDPERIKQATEEHGGAAHQYIGDLVLGGIDGIVTTFAVVSGVVGARLGSNVILIMGLANLLADGFSMATGSYLSAKSEREYYEREWEREAWEIEHFPEGERAELYEIYRERGHSEPEARTLVDVQTRDREIWTKAMMVEELGMLRDERQPILSGITTFAAFIVAGSVPLLVYFLDLFVPVSTHLAFPISLALSGLSLFILGALKVVVTRLNPIRSGLEILVVGGLAAAVAYGVGTLLQGIGG